MRDRETADTHVYIRRLGAAKDMTGIGRETEHRTLLLVVECVGETGLCRSWREKGRARSD